ncbi:PhoH family protein [Candidatus Saccharibacteria bacterium]|nr:PhoH family protein [Candidatus Saccharibacteria bacterium]
MNIETYHPDLVLGLDVLIGDPSILAPKENMKKKAEHLYIPDGYIYRAQSFHHEQSSRGEACRELSSLFRIISQHTRNTEEGFLLDNGTQVHFIMEKLNFFPKHMSQDSSRAQAIAVARELKTNHHNVAIMTGNDMMSTVAYRSNIDVAPLNPEVYTGRRVIYLPFSFSSFWNTKTKHIPEGALASILEDRPPLVDNEYIELRYLEDYEHKDSRFDMIGRFDAEQRAIVPLKLIDRLKEFHLAIYPKNAGQAMALDALLAPPDEASIVILSGVFGTGKTFLATAAGYEQTIADIYDQVFIVPRDGALGEKIGYLPGDKDAKVRPKIAPILDNLRSYLMLKPAGNCSEKEHSDKNCNKLSRYEIVKKRADAEFSRCFADDALIFMHGRTIPNSFILYDEFQDMERFQAKALLSRIGNNSKAIITGDPGQRTNPFINKQSNGLTYSATHLKGERHTRIITFTEEEITRSAIVRAIAARFNH